LDHWTLSYPIEYYSNTFSKYYEKTSENYRPTRNPGSIFPPLRITLNHLICQRVQVASQPWQPRTLSALSYCRANSYGLCSAIGVLGENYLYSKANWVAIVSEKCLGVQYLNSGQQRRTGGLASHRIRIRSVVQIICIWKHAIAKTKPTKRGRRYRYSHTPPQQTRFLLPRSLLFCVN